VRLEVFILEKPDPKTLRKLLRRHNSRILAVAVVLEVDNPQLVPALARHYGLRPVSIPASLFVEPEG